MPPHRSSRPTPVAGPSVPAVRPSTPLLAIFLCLAGVSLTPAMAAQSSDPAALEAVRAAVSAEMAAANADHTPWEYRDHDTQPGKDAVYRVIETPKGNLKRLVELNGHVLTGKEAKEEMDRVREFVNNPDEQAKRRKAGDNDGKQARELLNMLPNAFLWTITSQSPQAVSLHFRPNPNFSPPDMQSRVLGTMAGEMVVAREGNRIQTLRGTLTSEVRIGFGILGKIEKGGTFDVERRQLNNGRWQITETHVHIGGHALMFKTIGQQDDEVMTDWRLSTAPDLATALQQIER